MLLQIFSRSLILLLSSAVGPVWGEPVDFFSPKITRADLLKTMAQSPQTAQHEVLIGQGGEGQVYAVALRTSSQIETFALKKFFPDTDMEDNITALKLMHKLESEELLSGFKIIKFEELGERKLRVPLIEGQRLADLLPQHSKLPEFQVLWERYRKALRNVEANLKKLGYYSWHSGDEPDACVSLLNPPGTIHSESLIIYSDDELENGLFSIEPVNVMVEFGTGDFYVIDPL